MFFSYGVGMRLGASLVQWNRAAHPECVLDPNGPNCFTGAMVMRLGRVLLWQRC